MDESQTARYIFGMQPSFENADGKVFVEDLGAGRTRVRVEMSDPATVSPRREMETTYSTDLIRFIAGIKGPAYLCDEIARDEDPRYVSGRLLKTIHAYVDDEAFDGRAILDFGCGGGASTAILARAFPHSRITGVELNSTLLSIARERAKSLGFDHVTLLESPNGTSLPPNIGPFDFIVMNAVYEHLLPDERLAIMPKLYAALAPGGILFMDETPNRIYHREGHTTNLLFINYLPDQLAHAVVKKLSYRFNEMDWPTLLREGVRGGTEGGVVAHLCANEGTWPVVLEPKRLGLNDRLDLWFSFVNEGKFLSTQHRIRKAFLKLVKLVTGITYTRGLSLAIKKPEMPEKI